MLPLLIWACATTITALGVPLDMRRLRANRVGLSPVGWLVAAVCIGPVAGLAYLRQRPAAWRELMQNTWALVGDSTVPVRVRRERLARLRREGILGSPIYRACRSALDTEEMQGAIRVPGNHAA